MGHGADTVRRLPTGEETRNAFSGGEMTDVSHPNSTHARARSPSVAKIHAAQASEQSRIVSKKREVQASEPPSIVPKKRAVGRENEEKDEET